MENKYLLEKIIEKKNVSSIEIESLLGSCINGELTNEQLAAMLIGLRMKGETVDEILGLIHAMRKLCIPFLTDSFAIDTCGTGGDGTGSFNISTTVALVVAGAGIPVIKHGNKAASSLCGSADVLSLLGVNIMLTPEQAKKAFDVAGMIFLFAPLYHPAMKVIAPVRKALGTRTVFNYLGPFLNPGGVTRQLIGVPSKRLAEKLAKVASQLNYEHVILVSSDEGFDEIGINKKSYVYEIKGKQIKEEIVDPQKLGFTVYSSQDAKGGNVEKNATIIKRILKGEKGVKRDIVVLNSAYALVVSGTVVDVREGIKRAEESIDTGAAEKVLHTLIRETQKYV
jgi:anthranilate phosphoribosyltransferase